MNAGHAPTWSQLRDEVRHLQARLSAVKEELARVVEELERAEEVVDTAKAIAAFDPAQTTSDEFIWCGYCNQPEDSTILSVEDGWNDLPHAADCPGVVFREAIRQYEEGKDAQTTSSPLLP